MTALDTLPTIFLSPTPLDVPFAAPDPTGTLAADVAEVAQSVGLGHGTYSVAAVGNNAVLINHEDRVAARVELRQMRMPAKKALRSALIALAGGAPITPPLSELVHQLPDGRALTFWALGAPAEPTVREVGQILAQLHSVAVGDMDGWSPQAVGGMDRWNPRTYRRHYSEFLDRSDAHGLPTGIAGQLLDACDEAFDAVTEASCPDNEAVLVHGDPYPSNMVQIGERLVFCNLDSLSIGPREADLGTIEMVCRRFLGPTAWSEFLDGYGVEYDADRLKRIGALREAGLVVWMAFVWAHSPDQRPRAMEELLHRLDTLTDAPNEQWSVI